jgi:hypothetical protein
MASTLQMTGRLAPVDEVSVAGVRRSRFSLHLNTPHVRRWLLVQWVSTPVGGTGKQPQAAQRSQAQTEATGRDNLGRRLDDYLDARTLRRSF